MNVDMFGSVGLIATGFGSSPRWVAERDGRDGLVGDSWVTFGLSQERLCDVSIVLVVSVVSFWHWIRSVVCQLSEPRTAEPLTRRAVASTFSS